MSPERPDGQPDAPSGVLPASPCTRRCGLRPQGYCGGCGRTVDEITAWSRLGARARREVLREAERRLRDGA